MDHKSDPSLTTDAREASLERGSVEHPPSYLNRLAGLESWLDDKMGVEVAGVDRVTEENRKPPKAISILLFWFSVNLSFGNIATGMLGPEFGLTLPQSIGATVVGSFLGACCSGYTATLSMRTGLRQIAVSRYSFGFWPAKLCSVLNIVINLGFAIVNTVVAGQVLGAVSNYSIPIAVGAIIISVIAYLVSTFGYRVIHVFESYAWVLSAILLIVLVCQSTTHKDSASVPSLQGADLSGAFLSFLSINFAAASGWVSISGDYVVHFPHTMSRWTVWSLTTLGIWLPVIFINACGATISAAAISYQPWSDAYEEHSLGGLMLEIYKPRAWSKAALVFIMLTVLGNNIAVLYSNGLSAQLLGRKAKAVPRFLWSLVMVIIICAIAIAGRQHLSELVANFVSMLGYWTVSFASILFAEHEIFRKGRYNLSIWNDPRELPYGIAALLSLLVGFCAGGVTGMSQTWFVGPLAAKIGTEGGDIGEFLSFAFTWIAYIPLRYAELRLFGK